MLYAFFDGDNIGPTVEVLLLENKIPEAVAFSESIKSAILELEKLLQATHDVDPIIVGGDDILIRFDPTKHGPDFLEMIRAKFEHFTGNSMSCGVGSDIPQAIWHLHIAKVCGKDNIRWPE